MKVHEIISETFGPGFSAGEENGYGENHAEELEQERIHGEMSTSFQNERTPVSEFDIKEIERMVMPAARNKPEVKRQVSDVMATWQELMDDNAYIEDEVFNKLYKQYEQLKDSTESPLIKFNKIHAMTKEIKDAASNFDEESSGEYGDKFKDENGYFGK